LFQVVSIQPSERWRWEIRNSSMWPLKGGLAIPLTSKALVVRAGILVVGADDVAPGPVPEGARDVVLEPVVGPEEKPGEATVVVVEDCMETSIPPLEKQTFDLPQRQRKSDSCALQFGETPPCV
jgi:hypothetical protein